MSDRDQMIDPSLRLDRRELLAWTTMFGSSGATATCVTLAVVCNR